MISAAKDGRLAHDLPPQATVKYRGNRNTLLFDVLITSSVWLRKLHNFTYFVTVYCSALRKENTWHKLSLWELSRLMAHICLECTCVRCIVIVDELSVVKEYQFYSSAVFVSDLTYPIEKNPVWTAVSGLDSQESFGFRRTRKCTAVFTNADATLSLMIPSHIPTANISYFSSHPSLSFTVS